jgi:hypothetical protein
MSKACFKPVPYCGFGSALILVSKGEKVAHKKIEEIACFKVLDVLFRGAEGFSCSLDVRHGNIGIQFLIKKKKKFLSVKCLKFLVIKLWIRIRIRDQ